MTEHFSGGRRGCERAFLGAWRLWGGGEAVKEHLCNVRRGVFKTGERPPLQTRQSKASHICAPLDNTHEKRGAGKRPQKVARASPAHTTRGQKTDPLFPRCPCIFSFLCQSAPRSLQALSQSLPPAPTAAATATLAPDLDGVLGLLRHEHAAACAV